MLIALLLAQVAAPVAAPVCPTTPAALPADLAGWTATGTDLSSMRAVTVPVLGPDSVRPADIPPDTRQGFTAVTGFRVSTPGTYGVALGSTGWIDVYRVGDPTPLKSVRHGHGPACSDIRKIVRFALTPGAYQVVVGGLQGRNAKLLLVK